MKQIHNTCDTQTINDTQTYNTHNKLPKHIKHDKLSKSYGFPKKRQHKIKYIKNT